MNKTQLVDAVALRAKVSKSDAKKIFEAIMEVTSDTLCSGDKVIISGFGSFVVAKKQGRVGRNPISGLAIKIAPKNVVKFRPGLELSERVK